MTDEKVHEKKDLPNGQSSSKPIGVALYNYKANKDSPGGFSDLDLQQGMIN